MPRATRWSQLTVGLLAFAGIVVAVTAILVFARVGALHGRTDRLYMVTDRASDVIKGTEVWLGGQKVGLVTGVVLRPPSADTTERVAITMDVLHDYLPYIRHDSDVQIRPGGSLIGSPVVFITVGSGHAAAVEAGDTLRARAQTEKRSGIADIGSLGDSVGAIGTELKQAKGDFDTTLHEVSALRARSSMQAAAVQRAMESFSRRATRSEGSVALTMRDTARLRGEVSRVAAMADSIRAAAATGHGTVGRFRRDTMLVVHARRALSITDSLRAAIARYSGRAPGDSALSRELQRVHMQLDSLVQDAKHHPFRYIAL